MSSRKSRLERYEAKMKDNPLAGWVLSHVGAGKQYRTYREWSLDAGLNQNTVQMIVERGRADPDTLVKMAHSLHESPKIAFRAAGWLTGEEVEESLTEWEQRLLADARQLPPVYRSSLLDVTLPGLLRLAHDLESAQREAP